jgi:DNA adenine methylase
VGINRFGNEIPDDSMSVPGSTRTINRRPLISPLRYPGGKSALYSRLKALIRDSELSGCTYVEPYAGGAGAGLGLLVTGQVGHVVINDLDPAIHAFWQTVIHEPEFLTDQIRRVKLDVAEWRRQREVYIQADTGDMTSLGFATFYLNRTNVSGVMNGGPIGGLDQSGNYKIDARFNRDGLIERIRILTLYSDNLTASTKDGVEIIEEYSRRSNCFVYADPPYFEKAGSLYMNSFTSEDHIRLAKTLNRLHNFSWLLTYDDVPQVSELYESRRRHPFQLSYSAHNVKKATEIAVLSDTLPQIAKGWPLNPKDGSRT